MNTEEVKDVVVDEAVENAVNAVPLNVRGLVLLGAGLTALIGGIVYTAVKSHNKKKEQSIEEPVVDGQVAEA